MRLRSSIAILGTMAVLGSFGCRRGDSPTPDSSRASIAASPAAVRFGGCRWVSRERTVCTMSEASRDLHLFVPTVTLPIVRVDDRPAVGTLAPARTGDGWTAVIQVPSGATRVTVDTGARWSLAIAWTTPTPDLDALEQQVVGTRGPERAGVLAQTLAALEASLASRPADERHRARMLASRVARDAGEFERAAEHGQGALAEALERGELGPSIEAAEVLFHAARDGAERRWLLDLLEVAIGLAGDAEQEVRWRDARAQQSRVDGEFGRALEDVLHAERLAHALGLVDEEMSAVAVSVELLAMLGRRQELDQAIARALELSYGRLPTQACYDAAVFTNVGWSLLVERMLGTEATDPAPLFDRALGLYAQDGACSPAAYPGQRFELQVLKLDLAIAAAVAGDAPALDRWLGELEPEVLGPANAAWIAYVRGESRALAGASAAALASFATAASSDGDPLLTWRTLVRTGELHELAGAERAALQAYLGAERALERTLVAWRPDQGREGFATRFEASAAKLIALQLRTGDREGALRTARRSRSRALRPSGLAAAVVRLPAAARLEYHEAMVAYRTASAEAAHALTEAWRLPADERLAHRSNQAELHRTMRDALHRADAVLQATPSAIELRPGPAPGDLWLVHHPGPDGWFAFAVTSAAIDVAELGPGATALAALEPFAARVDEAERIAVFSMGALLEEPFHAVSWHGVPLVHHKPVAYALDLDGTRLDVPKEQDALVVADPAARGPGRGRLPEAAAEGEFVGRRLAASGYRVTTLSAEDATFDAVARGLGAAQWFHYAGHAAQSGPSGWDSALWLAGEAQLTVADVLTLPRAPTAVVLSACEAAGATNEGGARGTHLAAAFLLAGSEFVLAPLGPLDDAGGRRLVETFYRQAIEGEAAGGRPGSGPIDGSAVFRRAALELPEATWKPFFVWTR